MCESDLRVVKPSRQQQVDRVVLRLHDRRGGRVSVSGVCRENTALPSSADGRLANSDEPAARHNVIKNDRPESMVGTDRLGRSMVSGVLSATPAGASGSSDAEVLDGQCGVCT